MRTHDPMGSFHQSKPLPYCPCLSAPGILLWQICAGEEPRRGYLRRLSVPEDCPQVCMDEGRTSWLGYGTVTVMRAAGLSWLSSWLSSL